MSVMPERESGIKELASLADLLETDQIIEVESKQLGKIIKIRKPMWKDFRLAGRKSGRDEWKFMQILIEQCVVEPKIPADKMDQLKPMVLLEIAEHIMKYAGLTMEGRRRVMGF